MILVIQVSLLGKRWVFFYKETILGQTFATWWLVAQSVGYGFSDRFGGKAYLKKHIQTNRDAIPGDFLLGWERDGMAEKIR
jgi:hypothetical protein